MKKTLAFCLVFVLMMFTIEAKKFEPSQVILQTKQIVLENYPGAYNPSLFKIKDGFLLSFRYGPDRMSWFSYIGVALLDNNFEIISEPHLLNTRKEGDVIDSHAEDARIFSFRDELYLIYNDTFETNNLSEAHHRDIYIAKLFFGEDGKISLEPPTKIIRPDRYARIKTQKNWVPFVWEDILLFEYSLNPHEVVYPNLETGNCSLLFKTAFHSNWQWGEWRGGTPALKVDDDYLAFFHSSKQMQSNVSDGRVIHHYYMGAYTFSGEPPFSIKSASTMPIVGENFYTKSNYYKRVIFPGGFAVIGSYIYLAYGKDDEEIWIGVLDKNKLKLSLRPVK